MTRGASLAVGPLAMSAALLGACGTSPSGMGVQSDLSSGARDMAVAQRSYVQEKITRCGKGGMQNQIAVAPDGTTVGVVTIADNGKQGTCTLLGRPPMAVPVYDICFAESVGGGAFATTTVSSEKYIAFTGVGLAYAPSGAATVAYTGNAMGVAPAERYCGASNLLSRSGKAGQFAAAQTIATSSQSGGQVPGKAGQCIQDVCNSGDAVGFWPTLAYAPGASGPAYAYRDLHYGLDDASRSSSDLEFVGAGMGILTVDVARGGGAYGRMAVRGDGRPAIVHYNGERELATDGVWINQDTGAGGWVATRVSPARAGEGLGFAIGPTGTYALAWYDQDGARLVYAESSDGVTWAPTTDVDTDGVTGMYPSLAFGPDGQPAIAYYRCRDYDPSNRNCDNNRDGLMLARRSGGAWSVEPVSSKPGVFDGMYPALAFAGGRAVVAFMTRTFDPGSNTTSVELDVAREEAQ